MKGKHGASAERRREQEAAAAAVAAAERQAARATAEAADLASKLQALSDRYQQETRALRQAITEQRPPSLVALEEENAALLERLRIAERRVKDEFDLTLEWYQVAADAMEAAGIDPLEVNRLLGGESAVSKHMRGERGAALMAVRAKRHGMGAVVHSDVKGSSWKAAQALAERPATQGC